MIKLTRFNDSIVIVNSDLIEFVEATPDTIVTLTTGQKIIIKETVDVKFHTVNEYKRRIHNGPVGDK